MSVPPQRLREQLRELLVRARTAAEFMTKRFRRIATAGLCAALVFLLGPLAASGQVPLPAGALDRPRRSQT